MDHRPPNFPQVQGHRGALYHGAENTLQSFSVASAEGAEAVEMDVFLLADGATLAVFHGEGSDADAGGVEHLTMGTGNIQAMTPAQVRALQLAPAAFACGAALAEGAAAEAVWLRGGGAGAADGAAGGSERGAIPMLGEALSLCKKRKIRVTVELKGPGTAAPALAAIEAAAMGDRCCVSSFNHERAAEARRLLGEHAPGAGGVLVSLLYPAEGERTATTGDVSEPTSVVADALLLGAQQIDVRYDLLTAELVSAARAARPALRVMAWCRGPDAMEAAGYKSDESYEKLHDELLALNIDVICTNRVDLLAAKRDALAAELEAQEQLARAALGDADGGDGEGEVTEEAVSAAASKGLNEAEQVAEIMAQTDDLVELLLIRKLVALRASGETLEAAEQDTLDDFLDANPKFMPQMRYALRVRPEREYGLLDDDEDLL